MGASLPAAAATLPLTATESRALALLGSGVSAEHTAAALGVTASAISQLLSQDEFAKQVAELRYNNLSKHNLRDNKLDALEDTLIGKIEESLCLVHRPLELTRIFQMINAAKRRGSSTPEHITQQSNVVNINMPTTIINRITTNIHNQVVRAGEQDLLTMQSSTLLNTLQARKNSSNLLEHQSQQEVMHHDTGRIAASAPAAPATGTGATSSTEATAVAATK